MNKSTLDAYREIITNELYARNLHLTGSCTIGGNLNVSGSIDFTTLHADYISGSYISGSQYIGDSLTVTNITGSNLISGSSFRGQTATITNINSTNITGSVVSGSSIYGNSALINNFSGSETSIQSNLYINGINTLSAIQNQPYSYIVYKSGSTYYARNGVTGAVDYSSTNAAEVLNELPERCLIQLSGDTTYNMFSTYVMKAGQCLDGGWHGDYDYPSTKFTINTNVNGIEMNEGCKIRNIYIRNNIGVTFDKNVIYINGAYDFQQLTPTIDNVYGYSSQVTTGSTFLRLETTGLPQALVFGTYSNIRIWNFENAIILNNTDSSSWINSNSFSNIFILGSSYGIRLVGAGATPGVNGNLFSDIHYQRVPGKSVYSLVIDGNRNVFDRFLSWDFPSTTQEISFASTADRTKISNSNFDGNITIAGKKTFIINSNFGEITDGGTYTKTTQVMEGTKYSENNGNFTIPSGSTNVTVAHELYDSPRIVLVSKSGNYSETLYTTSDETNIVISVSGVASDDYSGSWYAKVTC